MKADLYTGMDPREIPAYSVPEAANYLRIPGTTLHAWIAGQRYQTKNGLNRKYRPVIRVSAEQPRLLSFWNLVEAYVLAAIRREHQVSLQKVRTALDFVRRDTGRERPLIEEEFLTDGVKLFVERYGELVEASETGQLAIRALLEASLRRIDRDPKGLAERLFPWSREPQEPRSVEIDPRRAFGRLVIVGTGISTAVIADRIRAGESIQHLAEDYRLDAAQIEAAIRWELGASAA